MRRLTRRLEVDSGSTPGRAENGSIASTNQPSIADGIDAERVTVDERTTSTTAG